MNRTVKVGDIEVKMSSMAIIDKLYWDVFHVDPVKIQTSPMDEAAGIDFITKMGFIMAKFAEVGSFRELKNLNDDDFYDWLAQFDRADLLAALPDIQAVYNGQALSTAEVKKKEE